MPHPHRSAHHRLRAIGAHALGDDELLAILVGGDRDDLAAALHEVGGVVGLDELAAAELETLRGIGRARALRLAAAIELGRRIQTRPLPRNRALGSSTEVDRALRPRLARKPVEHFLAIPLDAKNRPTDSILLAKGGASRCAVDPADVFRRLLRRACVGVVFVHNHPSGVPEPSVEDVALTRRLVDAGALLGVQVVDHVIIGAEGFFSFLDAGLLHPRTPSPKAENPTC